MKRIGFLAVPSLSVSLALGCAGAQQPETPATAEATPQPKAEPVHKASVEPEVVDDSSADDTPPPTKLPDPMPQPPSDIIGAPRVAYMINYPSSNVRRMDAAKCDKKTGGNPELHAHCMDKSRSEFVSDVLIFKKDNNEKWFWYIYKRYHGTLFEVSRTPIEFGDETEDTVQVRVTGNTKGTRPLLIGQKEFVVRLPSKYTLELDDPRFGQLLYESKIGLVNDE